jgi:hypothetical protein
VQQGLEDRFKWLEHLPSKSKAPSSNSSTEKKCILTEKAENMSKLKGNHLKKSYSYSWVWWFAPVIPVTLEAEIGRIVV